MANFDFLVKSVMNLFFIFVEINRVSSNAEPYNLFNAGIEDPGGVGLEMQFEQ